MEPRKGEHARPEWSLTGEKGSPPPPATQPTKARIGCINEWAMAGGTSQSLTNLPASRRGPYRSRSCQGGSRSYRDIKHSAHLTRVHRSVTSGRFESWIQTGGFIAGSRRGPSHGRSSACRLPVSLRLTSNTIPDRLSSGCRKHGTRYHRRMTLVLFRAPRGLHTRGAFLHRDPELGR
jgi:hypothetical protein